jgi:hypothetical protein
VSADVIDFPERPETLREMTDEDIAEMIPRVLRSLNGRPCTVLELIEMALANVGSSSTNSIRWPLLAACQLLREGAEGE